MLPACQNPKSSPRFYRWTYDSHREAGALKSRKLYFSWSKLVPKSLKCCNFLNFWSFAFKFSEITCLVVKRSNLAFYFVRRVWKVGTPMAPRPPMDNIDPTIWRSMLENVPQNHALNAPPSVLAQGIIATCDCQLRNAGLDNGVVQRFKIVVSLTQTTPVVPL